MRKITLITLTCCFLRAHGSRAVANDGSFSGNGATVFSVKESRVRMVRENISIRLAREDAEEGPPEWHADCQFEFENLTDKNVTVQMGFPDWEAHSEKMEGRYALKDFKTTVDGKQVPTALKPIDQEQQRHIPGVAVMDAAHLWTVVFAPHGKARVRNTFAMGGFSSMGPADVFESMPKTYPRIRRKHQFWKAYRPRDLRTELDFFNATVGMVSYIATTGRTWAGTIGEAKISIEVPVSVRERPHYVVPLPVGFTFDGQHVIWTRRDWKPKEELVLYYLNSVSPPETEEGRIVWGFRNVTEARAWIRFAAQSHYAPQVVERLIGLSPSADVKKELERFKQSLRKGS